MHRHGEEAAQPRPLHRLAAHLRGIVHEGALHAVLNDQSLDRARAGDALVEVPGDLGVELADLTVDAGELALKDRVKQHRKRQHRHDERGKAGVDGEHDHHRADHIAKLPNAVKHRPAHELADAPGVRHDAGVDIAHAVLVEVGKRQGLQVGEGVVSEILVHAHLDAGAHECRGVVDERGQQNGGEVERDVERQALQRAERDEVVQGVALKDRDHHVIDAAHHAAEDHHGERLFVVFEIGQNLADAEEGQLLRG